MATIPNSNPRIVEKLLLIDASKDSISTLSSYFVMHEPGSCCASWMAAFESANPSKLVPLVYLANDVLLRSRAKTQAFVQEFAKYMPAAYKIAGARMRSSSSELVRLTTIWKERAIYSERFMIQLRESLKSTAQPSVLPAYVTQHTVPALIADSGLADSGGATPPPPDVLVDIVERSLPPPVLALPLLSTSMPSSPSNLGSLGSALGSPFQRAPTEDNGESAILSGSVMSAVRDAQRRNRVTARIQAALNNVRPEILTGDIDSSTLSGQEAKVSLEGRRYA
jgi:hypothetical protein